MQASPLARRLLALIAYLPGGLLESEAQSLLGERGTVTRTKANDAISCLHQMRLVERRPDARLRTLTPLRECVKLDVPYFESDRSRLVRRYLSVAITAGSVGTKEWDQIRERVELEADNLDSVCGLAIRTETTNPQLFKALQSLQRLHQLSGRCSIESIHRAAALPRNKPALRLISLANDLMGRTALHNANYELARNAFGEARSLYIGLKERLGEAHCNLYLGQIAHMRLDHEEALSKFKNALKIYRQEKDMVGEANCVFGIGEVAAARSEHALAQECLETAGALHSQTSRAIGPANVVRKLGELAVRRGQYELARINLVEAVGVYRHIGETNGEASCIQQLAQLKVYEKEYAGASVEFTVARSLYRRIGDVKGEARCLNCLGQISLMTSQYRAARNLFEGALTLCRMTDDQALFAETLIRRGVARRCEGERSQGLTDVREGFATFFRIADSQDRALTGWQAIGAALTATDVGEAKKQNELAKSMWASIERTDLIHDWIECLSYVQWTSPMVAQLTNPPTPPAPRSR